ncbi:MAG: DUF4494 family protein [Bacteroidales bacterium]
MKNWKVGYKTIELNGDKKVKKEAIVQAESLADIEYTLLEFLRRQTNHPEKIEITDVKIYEMDRIIINDLVSFVEELKNEFGTPTHVEGAIFEAQEQFYDNTYFFEAVVEFFEPKVNGEVKKISSSRFVIPAESVKKATEECELYMKNEVTDWKIKDVKTTKTSSVILTSTSYNAAVELSKIVNG